MQFTDEMLALCEELRSLGHDAFASSFAEAYAGKSADEIEQLKLQDKYEHDAIREFWKPLQSADALLVANYDKHGIQHYIGGNAFLEMGFAHVLELPIYLLNPIPEMPYYHTELIAMKPVVLHGDLAKLA